MTDKSIGDIEAGLNMNQRPPHPSMISVDSADTIRLGEIPSGRIWGWITNFWVSLFRSLRLARTPRRSNSSSPARSHEDNRACPDSLRSTPQCTHDSSPESKTATLPARLSGSKNTWFIPPSGKDHRGEWHTYGCSYWHDGANWGIQIAAYGFEDAQERLRQIGRTGKVDGRLYAIIPDQTGFFVKAFCRLANLARRLKSALRGDSGGRS